VEWLMTENNQFRPANFVKNENLFEDYRYQPDVMNNKVEKTSSFRYMYGEWFPNDLFQPRNPNAPREIVDPAIGLILSNYNMICNEYCKSNFKSSVYLKI